MATKSKQRTTTPSDPLEKLAIRAEPHGTADTDGFTIFPTPATLCTPRRWSVSPERLTAIDRFGGPSVRRSTTRVNSAAVRATGVQAPLNSTSAIWAQRRSFPRVVYLLQRAGDGRHRGEHGQRAQVRDGIKSVATAGAPPETDWPYKIAESSAQQPPAKAYTDAKKDLVSTYARVAQNLAQMQGCLAEGYPFVFGFTVYESFESQQVADTGVVPMPAAGETVMGRPLRSGGWVRQHEACFHPPELVGSTSWGMKGYFTMPFEYLLSSRPGQRLLDSPARLPALMPGTQTASYG